MTRILIIGGGIAGTTTALALHKAGLEATVHEAHPHSAEDIGAFLTLASNGMRALAQIDAAEAVAATGFALTTMRVLDSTGAEIADTPLGEADHPLTRYRCLRRSELNQALQSEARRRGITIRHSARLTALTEEASGVTATFADGSTATGDLVIGADGLNSTVRSLVHPDAPGSHYAGQQVFYGYSSGTAPTPQPGQITMIRGGAAAFGYAVSPTGETSWFARVTGPPLSAAELVRSTPTQWRELLESLLRSDATPAADIVAATGDRLMATNACDLAPGLPWSTLRTLLIGDAAHAASPATGQGASMALEDAVVLAKALRDIPDTTAATAAFERLRRPRVEHNIAVSAQLTAGSRPSGPSTDRRPVSHTDEQLARQLDWATGTALDPATV